MKSYSCSKCPGYCCSYPEIEITKGDVARLVKHLGLTEEQTEARYTKGERLLRHQKDRIFDTVCVFLDQETRRCGVYEARPGVCRDYPESKRCGYYEFLRFERAHQGDSKFIALT